MATTIARLPGWIDRLSLMLVPDRGDSGPKVSMSKKDPPLPGGAALSLLAGGNDSVSGMLHPLIRRWTSTRTAMVSRIALVDGVGTVVREKKQITEYHREFVLEHDPAHGRRCRCGKVHDSGWKPAEVPDDDQIGTLPPREWLDVQVRHWRLKLGDHVPARTPGAIAHRPAGGPVTMWPAKPAAPPVPRPTLLTAKLTARQTASVLSTESGLRAWCFLHALEWSHQQQINRRLGLYRDVPSTLRPDDPLLEEIETRFGEPPRSLAVSWDVKYLLSHLDVACQRADELAIDAFAAELHALSAEILRALGEHVQPVWIGRCPAFIAEIDENGATADHKKPCGAGLWQQTGWAQVPCPRCHSVWDTRGPAGRTLNREIRKIWPIDRRRRYSRDDWLALPIPRCPECSAPVSVAWREVTGTEERRSGNRWYSPRSSTCPNGCDRARRIV